MIKDESSDIWLKLELINDVKRLGLSYHYEKEIGEALLRCHSSATFSGTIVHRSLHETALCFRLLREYGYHVTPGITKIIAFYYKQLEHYFLLNNYLITPFNNKILHLNNKINIYVFR